MRDAFRTLVRAPFFTIPVILLLALSIGANTLVFTAVHALLLKPLAVSRPAELYRIGLQYSPTHTSYEQSVVWAKVLEEHGKSFAAVFHASAQEMAVAVAPGGSTESATVAPVSGNFFPALGLDAGAGRLLGPGDTGNVVVISEAFRKRHFPGVSEVVAKEVYLRGVPFRILGVAPRSFHGIDLDLRTDLWMPYESLRLWWPAGSNVLKAPATVMVRLKPGVTVAQAESEVQALYPAMVDREAALRPEENQNTAASKRLRTSLQSIETGASSLRKTFRGAVAALMAGVIALLLLVCANVGGLMAARAQAAQRELALRLSLGATGWTMMRKSLFEGLLLAFSGAVGGMMLAWAGAPLLARMLEQRKPLGLDLTPDPQVLAYAVLACAVAAVVLGMLPAFQIFSADPGSLISAGSTRIAGGRSVARWLVMAQIALATLLAMSGISLDRTLTALREQDPGFRRDHLVVLRVYPDVAGYVPSEAGGLLRETVRQLETVPGVEGVAVSSAALLRGLGMKTTAAPAGELLKFENSLNISLNSITPNYFELMRMPLIAGRALREDDLKVTPRPAVVTESFAVQFFGGSANALGRLMGSGQPGTVAKATSQIVGVVRNARYRTMRETPPPTAFGVLDLDRAGGLVLHLAVPHANPEEVIHEVRRRLSKIGRGLVPTDIATIEREIEISLWQERMLSTLSSTFAVSALVLAGIGLFSMLAFSVAQRTREIGVRMALGATVRSVAGIVAGNALRSAVPGMALGLGLYALVSRTALESLLFGVRLWDPVTVAATVAGILATIAAACALPAVRAAAVDPAEALRRE